MNRSDIKADNILIDKSDNIKIADFGISVIATSKSKTAKMGEFGITRISR